MVNFIIHHQQAIFAFSVGLTVAIAAYLGEKRRGK
jgi:hypothetical protein